MRRQSLRWPALGILIGVLASFTCVVAAFQQAPDPRVAALITEADKLSLGLQFDTAVARLDEAIALAEKIDDKVGLASAFQMKGKVYRRRGAGTDALPYLERALSGFEAIGHKPGMAATLATLTAAEAGLGNQSKTRDFAARAAQLYDELGDEVGRAWLEISQRSASTDFPLTDDRLRQMADIARRTGSVDLLASVHLATAGQSFNKSDYVAAIADYESAIEIMRNLPDIEALASAYVSLGRVFRAQGDYEGALRRYQQAIDILSPTTERYAIVEATNAAAIALGHLNRLPESIAMYERGLTLARESGNQRLIDFMEGNLAGGYMDGGDWNRAIPLLEAAIAKKPEPSLLAYRQNNLALALTETGRAGEALPLIDAAVQYSREAKLVDTLADRLDSRSFVLKHLARFEDALADIRESLGILEEIRTRVVPADYVKRGYAESVQEAYRHGVDIAFLAGRQVEALEFAEQGRARAFLDLLAMREQSATGAAPPTAGKTGLASDAVGRPLDLHGLEHVAERLQSTVVEYWVSEDATLIWTVQAGTTPTSVRVPVGSKRIGELVAATTAALRTTAKAATTRGSEDVAPATSDDLVALPMRGLGLMALSSADRGTWRELYKILIEPIRAQLPARGGRVTIVPHGPLFHLSFAALQDGTGRYLIEDFDLNYAPSISVLDFTGRREQVVEANKGAWMIVGNPKTLPVVGTRPLPALPGAAREIAAIAAIAPKGAAVRLDGALANEAALDRAIETSNPSVLHFATHGFVFDDPKNETFLALNRRGDAPAEDGRLTLNEVYGLRLNTDLVVLSACRTGSGQVSSDGVIGLTRGFFYAGSPSVVATFWDVVDEATTSLMTRFYREYVRTHAKGASLHAAQVALLNDLRAGRITLTVGGRTVKLPEHPLLWAAFFLSGEP